MFNPQDNIVVKKDLKLKKPWSALDGKPILDISSLAVNFLFEEQKGFYSLWVDALLWEMKLLLKGLFVCGFKHLIKVLWEVENNELSPTIESYDHVKLMHFDLKQSGFLRIWPNSIFYKLT